ncbi:MAG: CdaR family protein [Spirochaetes bacterium]|nr:CdaR family protein [Spirochaetota bacterium]
MKRNKAIEAIFENWPAKVLSLVAALVLTVLWRINRLEERQLPVPLAVITNSVFTPASPYPRTVRLLLRGDSSAIFSLGEGDFEATIDLSDTLEEGFVRASVKVGKKGNAAGLDPLEVVADPAEISIAVERRISAVVPVVPSFRGVLETGFEISAYSLVPDRIGISGPASLVAKIRDVTTDYIELAGRSGDFRTSVQIVDRDPLVDFSGPDKVEFSAAVQKTMSSRSFGNLQVSSVGLPPGLAVAGPLPYGSARLLGARADLDAFEPGAGFLVIDLSDVKVPGSYTKPVRINTPPGMTAENWAPLAVVVEVAPISGTGR